MRKICVFLGYASAMMIAYAFGMFMEIPILRGDDTFAIFLNGMVLVLVTLLSDLLFSIVGRPR